MTESAETTLEEARRCPKCEQPGKAMGTRPAPRRLGITPGAMLHSFSCANDRCKWFEQIIRVVQVNPDGSIPTPIMRRDKAYPTVPDLTKQVNESLERQIQAELDPEAWKEVRR